MKSKILLFLVLLCTNLACYAQSVTLVETGIASTKDEATKQALRNALEQAYGTFVSSNTKIVNDQVTKDEIVSISQGNIEKYNEVSCQRVGNDYHVTVQATVSIGKLISYAKGKGASAEIAGATFGMNMKIKNLNKKNEEKALKHLIEELILFEKNNNFFDYSLDQSSLEPFESGGTAHIVFRILCKKNKNFYAYYDMLRNGLAAIGSRTKTEECTNWIKTITGDSEKSYDGDWYFRNDFTNAGNHQTSIINKLYHLGLFNVYKFKVSTGVNNVRCIGVTGISSREVQSRKFGGIRDFEQVRNPVYHSLQMNSSQLPNVKVSVFSSARVKDPMNRNRYENAVDYKSTGRYYKSNEPIVLEFDESYNVETISRINKIDVVPAKEIEIYEYTNGTWTKKITM